MMTMQGRSLSLGLPGLFAALGGLALLLVPPPARAQEKPITHPLHAAVRECHEAKKELEKAGHNFGGHKEAAIKDLDRSIKHLDRLIGWVKEHHKGEWEQEHKDEIRAEEKGESYPRLHAALHELRRAQVHQGIQVRVRRQQAKGRGAQRP